MVLSAAMLCAGLCACGSGGGGAASSGTTASNRAAAEPRSTAAEKAGRAAPFVEPHGDNSIPTYGRESTRPQRGQAEAALRGYLTARAGGEWSGACEGLTASLRRQVQAFAGGARARGCAAAYRALSAGAPASSRSNPLAHGLVALRLQGRRAFALFYGPDRQQYVMPMALEAGAWRVTQLAPIAYPLGSESSPSP